MVWCQICSSLGRVGLTFGDSIILYYIILHKAPQKGIGVKDLIGDFMIITSLHGQPIECHSQPEACRQEQRTIARALEENIGDESRQNIRQRPHVQLMCCATRCASGASAADTPVSAAGQRWKGACTTKHTKKQYACKRNLKLSFRPLHFFPNFLHKIPNSASDSARIMHALLAITSALRPSPMPF